MSAVEVAPVREPCQKHAAPLRIGSSPAKLQSLALAKRRLLIKLHEVPVAEFDDYRNFLKNLPNDVNRYVQTSSSSAPVISNAPVPRVKKLECSPRATGALSKRSLSRLALMELNGDDVASL
jgi:hypothetical protein